MKCSWRNSGNSNVSVAGDAITFHLTFPNSNWITVSAWQSELRRRGSLEPPCWNVVQSYTISSTVNKYTHSLLRSTDHFFTLLNKHIICFYLLYFTGVWPITNVDIHYTYYVERAGSSYGKTVTFDSVVLSIPTSSLILTLNFLPVNFFLPRTVSIHFLILYISSPRWSTAYRNGRKSIKKAKQIKNILSRLSCCLLHKLKVMKTGYLSLILENKSYVELHSFTFMS